MVSYLQRLKLKTQRLSCRLHFFLYECQGWTSWIPDVGYSDHLSFSSSKRFPAKSGARLDNPVTFPLGRARLATRPIATGSETFPITMGIVVVARFAAWTAGVLLVIIASTLRRTSSAARSGSRSSLFSATRNSKAM